MSLFDRIIDGFSKKDLKHRVRGVIAIGLAISAITIAGAYKFATTICTIDAEGTATLLPNGDINITIPNEKIALLSSSRAVDVVVTIPNGDLAPTTIKVISIDPNAAIITAQPFNLPEAIIPNNHFRIRVILDRQPYWKLLWGSGNRTL